MIPQFSPYGRQFSYGPLVIKAENVEEKNVTINILGNGQKIEKVEEKTVNNAINDNGCIYCAGRQNCIGIIIIIIISK